jgi:hypothetical protein
MFLNTGYPTNNTIVTPKVNHHTLHSQSYGLSIEGFMSIETDSKLGFEITNVNNLRSLVEFVLHGITGTWIKTLFGGQHTIVPLGTEIIGVPTIDGAIIMVCMVTWYIPFTHHRQWYKHPTHGINVWTIHIVDRKLKLIRQIWYYWISSWH